MAGASKRATEATAEPSFCCGYLCDRRSRHLCSPPQPPASRLENRGFSRRTYASDPRSPCGVGDISVRVGGGLASANAAEAVAKQPADECGERPVDERRKSA